MSFIKAESKPVVVVNLKITLAETSTRFDDYMSVNDIWGAQKSYKKVHCDKRLDGGIK